MLALHGFETWGLEVSQGAVDVASNNVQTQLTNPSAGNFGVGGSWSVLGKAKVILGDFFQRDWEAQIGQDFKGFDVVYDYTVSSGLFSAGTAADWV